MKHVSLLLFLFLLGSFAEIHAQNFAWAKQFGTTTISGPFFQATMTTDAGGNVYVTGAFQGTYDFDLSPTGVTSLTAQGSLSGTQADFFIAKYDALGNLVWVRQMPGDNSGNSVALPYAITVRGSYLYVAGAVFGTVDFDPSGAVVNLPGQGGAFLSQYTTAGSLSWVELIQGTAGIHPQSIITDAAGDLLLTGHFDGVMNPDPALSPTASLTSTGGADVFVAKYTSTGTYVWGRSAGSNSKDDESRGIGTDASGNCYVMGKIEGVTASFNPPTNTTVVSISGDSDMFLAKYDGATGVLQWVNGIGGSTSEAAYDLAVDASGNSYLVGSYGGTVDFNPSAGGTANRTSAGFDDAFLARYNTSGGFVDVQTFGSTGDDIAYSIRRDADGNHYLLGLFNGTVDFNPAGSPVNLTATGSDNLFLAKYDASGSNLWAAAIAAPPAGQFTQHTLGLDGVNNAYVFSSFSGTVEVDPSANTVNLSTAEPVDFFLAKYGECIGITGNPVTSSVVQTGSTVTAQVSVSGAVAGYQWYQNGTALTGQTSATLSLTNVQLSQAGSYSVVVTGACALGAPTGLTSTAFSLTVNLPCNPVIHVTESGSGLMNGTSWANSVPGGQLQQAIDAAATCSGQVWVAAGVYKPTTTSGPDSRTISFSMRNNVAIYGGFVGSETALSGRPAVNPVTGQPSSSTLSGEIGNPNNLTDNSWHVVYNPESLSLNSSAVLDGFVLTKGNGSEGGGMYQETGNRPIVRNCLFAENLGGGMYNIGSSPTLTNCSFQSNTASFAGGGGIWNDEGSSPILTNCLFERNQAVDGGGVWNISNSSPTLTNCTFRYNQAVSGSGGGLYNQNNSNATVSNCVFLSNSASSGGGAMRNIGSTVSITNCTFESNTALFGGGMQHEDTNLTLTNSLFRANSAEDGGGVHADNTILRVINTSFENNSSQSNGGAIRAAGSTTLTNCSFQSNSANVGNNGGTDYGAVIQGAATFINCVEFGNQTGKAFTDPITASYSLFAPSSYTEVTISGTSNLTATVSPFASLTNSALGTGSPAIDAGDPATSTATVGSLDLAGNARFFNGGRIDMGAYEFQGVCVPTSFSVLGSGTATCAASPTLTLTGSETGVSYQLQRNGTNTGNAVIGTGSALSFGPQSLSGIYTVQATGTSGCTALMATSATVVSGTTITGFGITASASVCAGTGTPAGSVTLTASGCAVGTIAWPGGITGNIFSATIAGTYTATCTIGQCTTTASQAAVVKPSSYIVNTLNDFVDANIGDGICADAAGNCTFRAAVQESNASSCAPLTITFGVTGAISLTSALPTLIHPNLSILGPGASLLTIERSSDVGTPNFRVLSLNNAYVLVKGLTIRNGLRPGSNNADRGAGIMATGEATVINNCVIRDNYSGKGGGGIASSRSLTLTNSSVSNNTALNSAGAQDGYGGGLYLSGAFPCQIESSTIAQNRAYYGGGMYIENRIVAGIQTLISSNTATGSQGGGLYIETGSAVILTNCLAIDNRLLGGTAGHMAFVSSGTLTMDHCSVGGNTNGTSIRTRNATGPLVIVQNSIFASLSSPEFDISELATLISLGNNIVDDSSMPAASRQPNDLVSTNPLFVSATDLHLQDCSPAINRANPTDGPNTDFEGNARPALGIPDIGAYENQTSLGLPVSYSLLGSGTATCTSSPTLTLSGSETGVSYQLRRSGATIGNAVVGTGSALSFGPQTLSGTYTVLATRAGNSCTALMATSATVVSSTAVPTVSISATSSTLTCARTSVTLTATTAETALLWSNGSTTSSITVNVAATYSVTVTNASGCTAVSNSVVINQNTTPPGSASLTPSHSGTLTCAQTALTLTASATETSLSYVFGSGVVAQSGSSATVNQAGNYTVVITGSNGCTTSASTTVYSNTAPPTLTINPSSGTLTCAQTSLTLTASGTGTSYVWTRGSTGATFPVSASGTYSVTATAANGCTAVSNSTTIFSNTLTPTAGLVASGTITCANPTVILTASGIGTYTFAGPSIVATAGGSATVNVGGVYSVTVLNPTNGCFSTTDVTISSDLGGAPAAPTLSASSSVVCAGGTVQVVATVGVSSGLQWYKDGQAVSGQTSATLTLGGVQASQAGRYVLVVSGACSVTSSPFTLAVNPLPVVTLSFPTGTTVGAGNPPLITLPDPLPAGFDLSFGVSGGVSYERVMIIDRINGYEVRSVDNSTGRFPITRPGLFTITATDGNGCRQTVQGILANLPAVGR